MKASEEFEDIDCDSYPCGIDDLPNEILSHILTLLDVQSLCSGSQVCRRWYGLVYCNDGLWKLLCRSTDQNFIQYYRDELGWTWKTAFIKSYGSSGIKRKWTSGVFSSPHSYSELPPETMCVMDAEAWGKIFQMEMQR